MEYLLFMFKQKKVIPFSKHILDMSAIRVEHSRKQEKNNQIFTLKHKINQKLLYHYVLYKKIENYKSLFQGDT